MSELTNKMLEFRLKKTIEAVEELVRALRDGLNPTAKPDGSLVIDAKALNESLQDIEDQLRFIDR